MAASEALTIAGLDASDIEDCLKLSDEAGWNQTEDDWRLFIEQGRTWGVRDPDGTLGATAAALPYERDFSYIAMVLVTEAWRRRGLATRLVDLCVEHIVEQRRVPMLDATAPGEAVYSRQGFETIFRLERWQSGPRDAPPGVPASARAGLRAYMLADRDLVVALDAAALGARRSAVIADFLSRPGSRAFVGAAGFGLVRHGRRAMQIGPIVAETQSQATALLEAVLSTVKSAVFIDVPVRWQEIGAWLAARGFTRQRGFARMAFGRSQPFGRPDRLFAVGGPEFG